MVKYCDSTHTYKTEEGKGVPSVTYLAGAGTGFEGQTEDMASGSKIHAYIGYWLSGGEISQEAHDWLLSNKFGVEKDILTKLKVIFKEWKPVIWEAVSQTDIGSLSYAGTCDLVMEHRKTGEKAVLDVKTGESKVFHKQQIKLYALQHEATIAFVLYPSDVKSFEFNLESVKAEASALLIANADGRLFNGKIYSEADSAMNERLSSVHALIIQKKQIEEQLKFLKEDIKKNMKEGENLRGSGVKVIRQAEVIRWSLKTNLNKKLLEKLRGRFFTKKVTPATIKFLIEELK